ncbi:beta-N-acetylhexosaminidase [Actinoallomurus bryophytorum]|uniref:beta-N-acetylhexosaminidase n=1 Tax=Actinoallomurus bryophytorum TaxID=1490222 RepID=A0A543BSV7_9ACTN|nr:beta-N-acetylhexosaminidase [Actinoallomurus bryophytorum]TQL87924.1 hexosaminidase [Actinoallomurus bryophytorum]
MAGPPPTESGTIGRMFSGRRVLAATVAAAALVSVPGAPASAGGLPASPAAVATPHVVPAPTSLRTVPGVSFTLTRKTRIVARPGSGTAGSYLAGVLRRSTGYPLPVTVSGGSRDVIDLALSRNEKGEGYRLAVTKASVRLEAGTAEGLFRGVQTLRQLLPPSVESPTRKPGPWTMPGVQVEDSPRFAWRGIMLDVSRHFFTVQQVERYIDQAAAYKINMLHLHLSDDQGWRIAINGWPRLTTYGGSTAVGGGKGGYYTQADYTRIVRYAAERYMTVVPEIDGPGHTNAALASYAQLNCDGKAPPLYTGTEVGFSSWCIAKPVTYELLDDVLGQLARLTPGPYLHIGGDEAHSTTPADYATFIGKVAPIVGKYGKKVAGWNEIGAGKIPAGSVAQYWNTAKGSEDGTQTARDAVAQGAKVVMSPANHAYLDMKYDENTPLGQDWAGLVEVQDSYDWDPATLVDGVTEKNVLGVEAPLWSETLVTSDDIEYMAFPRLPAIAEIGWSPQAARAWSDFRLRLAAQGPRWTAAGVHFYRSPQVPWPTS